ncbi:MAG: tripartite tricarboxylate transporter substrate binding protein [Deltaproteobacteria bacterium]|nr:tripartite tricarboxylate transporter substrate binding protein [Deltaproteobacteria bacterium]
MRRSYMFLFLGFVLSATLFFIAPAAPAAETFPSRSITLIVPYPAGGATDLLARPLADEAKKSLGQSVIVENRAGGGGAVGVGAIVGKKPDGYLLSVAVESLHRNSYINKLPFDTVKDLTPIIAFSGNLYGICVRADSPHKTLKDLLNYAKANPGKVSYMASGVGTSGHISMEELAVKAGNIILSHVPSKGDQESSAALMGGHVDAISTSAGFIPLVEAGQLRLLATYTAKRTKKFPNVPTVDELGYGVVCEAPIGIFGPKGMPADIVKTLHDAFKKAMDSKAFLTTMDNFQQPAVYMNPAELGKYWAQAYVDAEKQVNTFIKKK